LARSGLSPRDCARASVVRRSQGIRGREAFVEFVAALRRDSPDFHFAEAETVAAYFDRLMGILEPPPQV
jgi:hypothetical protein